MFGPSEPPRKESPGEAAQRFADMTAMAVPLFFKMRLSQKERDAVATLYGAVTRIQRAHSFEDFQKVIAHVLRLLGIK